MNTSSPKKPPVPSASPTKSSPRIHAHRFPENILPLLEPQWIRLENLSSESPRPECICGQETSRNDNAPSPSLERQHGDKRTIHAIHAHRIADVISHAAVPATNGFPDTDMPSDWRTIVHDDGVAPGVSAENSIVSLETNDILAVAPGTLDDLPQLARSLLDIQALENELS